MRRVYYSAIISGTVAPGHRVILIPVNHPDHENVTNGLPCYTTPIQKINGEGNFETLNTNYVFKNLNENNHANNRMVILENPLLVH